MGRRVDLGSAPLCLGDLGQQRCGSGQPRGVKLRHIERSPELVVGRVLAAAAGCRVKVQPQRARASSRSVKLVLKAT